MIIIIVTINWITSYTISDIVLGTFTYYVQPVMCYYQFHFSDEGVNAEDE